MAATLSTAARNAACDAIVDLIDGGASAGTLEIQNSGGTVLATITLSDPAFGSAATGVATMAGVPLSDTSADATGTAAKARYKDSNGTVIVDEITVGTSGTQIIIDNTSITTGQTVTVTAATFTMPAS